MGLFFNRKAVTFDPAPFRLAATQESAHSIADFLSGEGFIDSDLQGYTTTESLLRTVHPELIPTVVASGWSALT
jgi:hypothetical protein